MSYDREAYFAAVADRPFGAPLTQPQVDGQEAILAAWEQFMPAGDRRWLAYMLASAFHETARSMQPVMEAGFGAGRLYAMPDLETGQAYYGRGFVPLRWNIYYGRADDELELTGIASLLWYPQRLLELPTAARVMQLAMSEGWLNADIDGPFTLARFFSDTVDDPYNARDIVAGDKDAMPEWSPGLTVGTLVSGYHQSFMAALAASEVSDG